MMGIPDTISRYAALLKDRNPMLDAMPQGRDTVRAEIAVAWLRLAEGRPYP